MLHAFCYLEDMTSHAVIDALKRFTHEREWGQFHTPENLAKSISIEAAELLECFQWDPGADLADVTDELADVLTYCTLLAMKLELDPSEIILDKLSTTASKYPVEKARGRSDKYDQL